MIAYNPQTNCITEWNIENWPRPLNFTGWGCEVGNWFGFFAHERLGGTACEIVKRRLEPQGPTRLGSHWLIKLPKAILDINLLDEISENKIARNLSVSNYSDDISWLGDAVIRVVVPWEEGLTAELEHREIVHRNSNFYYDTEDPEVALRWTDGRRLVVRWLGLPVAPAALTPYLYVRDQPARHYASGHAVSPAWVIHARLLVDYPAALVWRLWRNPLVLWSRGGWGRFLISPCRLQNHWRTREWKSGYRTSIYGLWPLAGKDVLNFSVEVEAVS
jgi:hypothetical protein